MQVTERDGVKIVRTEIEGEVIFFTIRHEIDVIQRHHLRGAFYEPEEISIMAAHIPDGGVILDIGTNVGNHALWFAKFRKARRIYLFEPNPEVIAVLRSNISLNGIADQVVTDHLGIGLSDKSAGGYEIRAAEKNLGGGRMLPRGGDLEVRAGDDLVPPDVVPDFIKIDVERMEMEVLAGLENTISRSRPPIFVEVDVLNLDAFSAWCADHAYRVIDTRQRSKRNINHMLLPD